MKKTTINTQLKAGALALALATLPAGSQAAGLGKLTVFSVIGQPLRAEIDITASREEAISLRAKIASFDAFQKAGIDYASVLSGIRVSIDQRADGRPYLQLRSDKAIYDPFLDVLLEVNWASGMLVREYTFLLDPPDSLNKSPAQAEPVSPPTVAAKTTSIAPATREATAATETTKPAGKSAKASKPGKSLPKEAPKKESPAEETQTQPPTPEQTGATHQVKPGETLGRIASKLQPEGVDLDQMLVALFRNNPEAFDGKNINRLKAGKILAVPDAAAIAAIDTKEARQFIVAQSADFSAYRRKLASAAATTPAPREESAGQSTSGKVEPRVEEKTPTVTGKDKLEISRSAAARGGDAKTPNAQAAAKEEDRLAKDKALKDANSRAAELDKNLADMKKLLELKSQGMADAQKQAQAAKTTPAPAAAQPQPPAAGKPAAPKPADPTPPVAAKPAEPASAPLAAKPAEPKDAKAKDSGETKPGEPAANKPVADKPAEQAATPPAAAETPKAGEAAEKPAQAPAPVKPARKKVLPPPPPPEEPDFIEANPELLMGGGGILALLLGYLGFSQWKKKRKPKEEKTADTTGPSSQSEPSINSVFGNASGQTVDTGSNLGNSSLDADFSVASVGGVESNEGVDPIAEADVYMAYGRNAQAEEILLDALKTEPTRHAIHVKLLDIYAARKSLKQFEAIATDLRDQTGGNGDEWDQAVILGKQIDPDNPLYSEGAPAPVAEDEYDPAATMVMSADEMEQLARDLAAPGNTSNEGNEGNEAAVAEPIEPEETAESLDFELDLGGDSVLEAAGPESDAAPEIPAATPGDNSVMDFDLGVDEPAVAINPPPAASNGDSGMDFDLNIDAPFPGKTAAPEEDDLKFDLGNAEGKNGTSEAPAALSVDLSSISLDLEAPAPAPEPAASPATSGAALEIPPLSPAAEALSTPLAFAESTPADDGTPDAPASPEVDTKLELASAYEEMGDKEGARELLQEVLNEGNNAQKAAARSKLEQLG